MNTLHLMVGLPRSGKSTTAKQLGFPVVELDAIRTVLHGTPFRPSTEHLVWAIAHIMVESLFEAGATDVTLDATNHTQARRDEWVSKKWATVLHPVLTAADVCRERAVLTNQEYLLPIITRMAAQWDPPGGIIDG